MKGNYFLGDEKSWLNETPVPETGEHDVLIRVAACGIYGMDAHIYHGSKGSVKVHLPMILGYELAGAVEKTGSAVTTVRSGDHVTVDPNSYCGKCHYCKTGRKQVCESLYVVGVNRNGGFAQYCAVPETQCYQLDKEIPLKYGAMTELLAYCIHGIDRIGLVPGNTACVIEGGAIRLIMVQLTKLSGAPKVVLSEPVSVRREIGMKVGADVAIDPVHEEIRQRLIEIPGTLGADVVIECVGIPVAVEQAFEVADKRAVILLFSASSSGSTYVVHLEEIFQEELTIVEPIINPDTHGHAVALTNSNATQLEPLTIHLLPLDQLEQVILAQQSSESIKVIVEP